MAEQEPTPTDPAPDVPPAADPAPQPAAPDTPPAPEPAPQPAAPAGSTVNAHKYQRDISKLENERDEARAEAEGFKGLKAEFEAYKAEQAKEKAEAALKAAGCIDTVAASARLGEFEGDVEKLKGAAPYLFASSDKSKSTGGNPKGTPDPEDERTRKVRSYMGLDTEKE